jgi:hypothetical protein
MSNKTKRYLQFVVGTFALVTGAAGLLPSMPGNKPLDLLFDPNFSLFFNGLLILADLAISQPFQSGDNEAARSNIRRQVATWILRVLGAVIVLVSIYQVFLSVSTYGWGFETRKALGNLAAALATAVVLLPYKNPLSQMPDRGEDHEARSGVLSMVQNDVKDNWKPELIPTVTLPIKFSLKPDFVHPLTEIDGFQSTGSIVDIYDSSGGRLLILGGAGAGKTTFGLEIINEVAKRAEAELSKCPIPIWLRNLSTWRSGQSFDEWIISELEQVYRVPADIGAPWIYIGGNLTLVLDGLEEIGDKDVRRQFLSAVNDYAQRYTGKHTPIILLSRTDEYLETDAKLVFNTAVEVQPLTKEEIIECLEEGGPELGSVRQILLEADPDLFELAQRPFWLGLISSAYVGTNARDFTKHKRGEIRLRILDLFIRRRWNSAHMKPSQVNLANTWLSFIATKLKRKEQSKNIFFVDELDRNWLETFPQKAAYVLVPSILAVVLGVVVAGIAYTVDIKGNFNNEWNALHGDVIIEWDALQGIEQYPGENIPLETPLAERFARIFRNEILAFIYSYIYFFIVWQPARPQKWRTIAFVHGAVLTILTAILAIYAILMTNREILGEIGNSTFWSWLFTQSLQKSIPRILEQIISGSYLGLLTAALTGALMIGLSARAKHTIGRFEWSWPGAGSGLKPGLIVVLFLSLIIGVGLCALMWDYLESEIQSIRMINPTELDSASQVFQALVSGLSPSTISVIVGFFVVSIAILVIVYSYIYFALYIVPTCLLLYGLQGRMVASRSTPAHALREWTRNSFYALLVVFVGSALILLLHNTTVEYAIDSLGRALTGEQVLRYWQIFTTRKDLLFDLAPGALQFGLPFGVAAGLALGGKMLIKHYATLAILSRWKLLPWDVIEFLDKTTSLTITKRSSGGYTFYHPIVRDHFARNHRDYPHEPELDSFMDTTDE